MTDPFINHARLRPADKRLQVAVVGGARAGQYLLCQVSHIISYMSLLNAFYTAKYHTVAIITNANCARWKIGWDFLLIGCTFNYCNTGRLLLLSKILLPLYL